MARRSLLDASRSAVLTLRSVERDMRNDGVAPDLIGEVRAVLKDLETALLGDGGGLAVDARPALLSDPPPGGAIYFGSPAYEHLIRTGRAPAPTGES